MSTTEEIIVQQVVDTTTAVVNSETIVDAVTEAVVVSTETIAETITEVVKETTTASTLNEIALLKYKEYFALVEPYLLKVTNTLNSLPGKYLHAVDRFQLTPTYKWLSSKVPFPNYTIPEW